MFLYNLNHTAIAHLFKKIAASLTRRTRTSKYGNCRHEL